MSEETSANPRERIEPRHRPDRVALWSALLALHSVLLVAAYWWIVVAQRWTGESGRVFALCAFVGLLAVIGNAVSSLAHANETGILYRGKGTRDVITKTRALIWVALEITSLAMLSFCAAILLYRVLNAG